MLQVKNRAVSTLASGISDTATSLTVASGEGAKFPSTFPFHITIDDEILRCSARTSDSLTVVRAQEGTSAAAHSTGATVSLNITAGVIQEVQGLFDDVSQAQPSRALGTIYQNSTKIRIVVATIYCPGSGNGARANVGASSPPTTEVGQVSDITGLAPLMFVVLPNYYYRIIIVAGSPTKYYWTEWDLH